MRRLIAALLLTAVPALAQEAPPDGVPDRRVAISQDTDFPGGDLGQYFDLSLDACQATCLADRACVAFTYNRNASACFPKSQVGAAAPFAGAVSGRVFDTDPAVLAQAAGRVAQLPALQPADLEAAETLGRDIGREHSSDENTAPELLASAQASEAAGDPLSALMFTGAAVALTDAPDLWSDYARLALLVAPGDDASSAARARAVPAAIAGWLRAQGPGAEAQALLMLARALEADGRGKDSVAALRLAVARDPSPEAGAALDRAVGLYGFNVVQTDIQSESPEPRACVTFNDGLRAGLDYAPFVQLPDDSLTVTAQDGQLCIEGLAHGQRLRVTLREGLPSASGDTLARSIPLDLYVRDRAPSVRVLSRAYVLPRTGAATLPVETVNLSEVALRINRVNDRNLLRTLVDGNFASPVYGWDEDWFAQNIGAPVWEGTVAVRPGEINAAVVTDLPVAEALKGQPAGVYALTAGVPGQGPDQPSTSQWFVLSDLGIATYQGTDGLTVAVRSLADAAPVAGARVLLLSRSNGTLGTVTTDAEGIARFDAGLARGTGGNAPALVTVTTGEAEAPTDLAFLSLLDPAFDLSDRGVEGRAPAGPLDAFLATDRGAYRAGETIHATALLRDDQARAVEGVPLTAILTRPDGVESARTTSVEEAAGGHVFAFDIAPNAPRGTWRLSVKADPSADGALAEEALLVEDFLPERIDVTLAPPAEARLDGTLPLGVQADWLFGAPAAGIALEGEVTLAPAATLGGWEGWTWGRHDAALAPQTESFGGDATDATGAAQLSLVLPQPGEVPAQPLEARVTLRAIEASGRPVEREATVPVAAAGPMIGLRLPADVVPQGSTAQVGLVAVGPGGAAVPMTVRWTVNRIDTDYQWYELGGQWNWEPVTRRVRVATGTVDLGQGPATVPVAVDWGEYEVVAEDAAGGPAAASATFSAGWYVSAEAEAAPDRLEVSLDAASYRPGDTATLRIVAEAPGEALVSVLSDRVVALRAVAVAAGATEVRLPVTEDWGAGAYVAAQLIRPVEGRPSGEARAPVRALGLAHAAVDPGDRRLQVALEAPDMARPRGPLTVGIDVPGVAPGDTAYVTLAAVDVGLLNLTGFEAPDPAGHYFGQQRLGVELRDLYGRLIEPGGGALGALREGGDAMGPLLQSPPPTEKLLAYFEGPVEVGADGTAQVTFDLPAFNGTVRLMAVAWSQGGVGQASRDVTVRDPVVLTASLPRVLSPGDTSRLRLDLTETEGTAGAYRVEVAADGVTVSETAVEADLAARGSWRRDLTLTAAQAGVHEVTVTVVTPSGERLARTYPIAVTDRDPAVAQVSRLTLEPGQSFRFDDSLLADFAPGSGEAVLSVGPLARMNVAGLLAQLDAMPYGCTEQLASGMLPLLYLSEVAKALDLAPQAGLDARIDDTIRLLLANQDSSGSFGLWGPSSGDLWLDSYVTDVLSRARERGHAVPDAAFEAALLNLRNQVAYYADFESGGEDLAYALLVLAREGRALVGDLRYYADVKADAFGSPLAVAQLGAALASYGDQPRADALFAAAGKRLAAEAEDPAQSVWRADYGTKRRDEAAVLTLAVESGSRALDVKALAADVGAQADRPGSTQESVWTLLAAAAIAGQAQTTGVTVDGRPLGGPTAWRMSPGGDPVSVVNSGAAPVELTVTSLGVPQVPPPAGGTGWAIDRAYYTMEGEPVAPDRVAAGTRLVAVLTVTPRGFQAGRMMVNDPLPGGFEIENPDLMASGAIAALPWLSTAYTAHSEARDDRFLAAVDWQSSDPFQVAYVLRAVTPGTYDHPAPSVEDMYRPALRAQGAPGQVTVTE